MAGVELTFVLVSACLACVSLKSTVATATPWIDVAVTVDDLPAHGPLPPGVSRLDVVKRFIDILKRHHVATPWGFVIGEDVDKDERLEAVLTEWTKAGFRLGNHTYSHMNLEKVTADQYEDNILEDEEVLEAASDGEDFRWFRFPFLAEGETEAKRDAIREFLADNNYRAAPVTFDFLDYQWNEPYARCMAKHDAAAVAKLKKQYLDAALTQLKRSSGMARMLFGREMRQTLLLHIGAFDAEMLDALLTELEQNGVHYVSLSGAHADEAYKTDPTINVGGRRNFLDQLVVHAGKQPPKGPLLDPALKTVCE